ncbi:MAG: FHA domain-containing protein [Anaerolineaceae bacterium]|nr:FHA domain-containing protein [Anaerolineaceae bacterium]
MADTLYQLTVRKGPKVGETFLLETFSLTVGRDPVSDVVLNDPEVSRQHARFSRTDSGYQVQDLGSTNGTFVNGLRLEAEPADLQPGYTVSMGSGVTLVYELVPTGAALDATMIDQSGLAGMAQQGSSLDEPDDEWEAAVPDLPHFDDEPEIPSDWEPDPSPPFTPPPPAPVSQPAPPPVRPQATAAPPFVPAPTDSEAAAKKRRNTIIAVVVGLILLCCCAFLVYMWFIGGDLLLEALGMV